MNFIKKANCNLFLLATSITAEQKVFMIKSEQPMVAIYDDQEIYFSDNKLLIKNKINWQKPNMLCTKNLILKRPDYVLVKYKNISNTEAAMLLPQNKILSQKPMIVIDAGHGGTDKGAFYHGLKEKDLALKISKLVHQKLAKKGLPLILIRERDKTVSLESRVALAQKYCGLYVSIHLNSAPKNNVTGLETFWCDPKKISWQNLRPGWVVSSKEFAQGVHQAILNKIPHLVDRGVKHGCPLVLIGNMHMPAILIECGFISNKEEAKKIADPGYQDQLADAIALGIESYWHNLFI